MTDQAPRLRTAFQFRDLEQQRAKLERLWQGDARLARQGRQLILLRAAEAGLIWIGLPAETRSVRKALDRRERGQSWEPLVPGLDRVVGALECVAVAAGRKTGIGAALLQTVHGLLVAAGPGSPSAYRRQELQPEYPCHQPLSAESIPGAVDRSMDWFQSAGARELHALERAALVTARLASIGPFERGNLPAVTLLASYCLLEGGLFAPAFYPGERVQLQRSLQDSESLNTQPLVDLYVDLQMAAMASAALG